MSNDLISRSEVLKTLEYVFNKYNMAWDKHGGFAEEVPEAIRNLPTAYDVDKVVEQIESIMDDESIRFCDQAVKRAVNIVKVGGIIDNH